MKKYKYGIAICLFLILVGLINFEEIYAAKHQVEKLHIHVFINQDGSANITERREAYLTEGTENYMVIENLGKSTIKDFIVTENGKTYQFIDDWDLKASQSEKAFKNGIIETKNGYELSWGIGRYGYHEYIVQYTITDFIKQLQDSQILFWRFVNDQQNTPPMEVMIEIETESALSEETESIWGFGFNGEIDFLDGKIVATNDYPLDEKDYVTILVKFADGMFTTGDHLDKSFDEIQEEALKGSDYGKENRPLFNFNFIKITFFILFVLSIYFLNFYRPSLKLTKKKPKTFFRRYHNEYYRDYPYAGDFLDIYYLLYVMGVSNFEKLLTAFILKWMKEEKIIVETKEVSFFSKEQIASINFLDKEMDTFSHEGKLFHMMLLAAGSDKILTENEFRIWTGKNRKKIIAWEKDIVNDSLQTLIHEGYVERQEERKFFIKRETFESTAKGLDLERKVHLYVNYLYDYSLLNEHEAINVKIWDDIMVWAALLGLTDVVRKQFNNLYPQYEQETSYSGGSLHLTNSFTQSASEGRVSRGLVSGGGGGSTSSGGGGGSFGGGSGGGTR
ncbi:DUF2207 family protein [Pseudogracilibacillus sp. SO30301A]|uniref:DUF2207 family protein n=1 Tax=Pseudogracilibacillus sp. SO30301A TaxID=3098291 RepID=UPI00300DCF15